MADNSSCCVSSDVEATADFAVVGGAKPFLERIGVLAADRLPGPRVQPSSWRVHSIPLKAPTPLPDLQSHLVGDPPPDHGKTLEWPHPDWEQEAAEAAESGD